jgi:hypothetical protein
MNHHIGHSSEIPLDLILYGIGKMVGTVHMHLRVDQDMEINVDIIHPAPAPNLMALFYSFDGAHDSLDLLDLNRYSIAEHSGALSQNIHRSISDEDSND